MTLSQLIAAVERAEGAGALSRDDLIAIFRAARPRASFASGRESDEAHSRFMRLWDDEAYLDAAVSLVPEGAHYLIGFDTSGAWAKCYEIDRLYDAPEDYGDPVNAASPALALTAAALRAHEARAAMEGR